MLRSSEHLCSFTWKIENFSLIDEDDSNKIYSPTFILDTPKTTSCCLALYPNYSDDNIGLFFIAEGCLDYSEIDYELAIIDINDLKHSIFERTISLLRWSETGSKCLIRRKDIFSQRKLLLPNDVLTIRCEIYWSQDEIDDLGTVTDVSKLSKDLSVLLHRSSCFDWILIVGTEKLYLHKTILKARCLEIANLLEKISHEKRPSHAVQSEEVFPNFDGAIVKALMKYLYSGTLDATTQNLKNSLATAADVFNLSDLKSKLFPVPTHVYACTGIEAVCIPVTCPINNFTHWKDQEKLVYPFHASNLHIWAQFNFIISLMKDSSGNENVIIHISPEELENDEQVFINCKISLLSKDGSFTVIGVGRHLFANKKQWQFPANIPVKYVKDRKQSYLKGNVLKIHCVMSASNGRFNSYIQRTGFSSNAYNRFENRIRDVKTFRDDLKNLYLSKMNADVVLVLEDDKYLAHEAVLSARSGVFSKMLSEVRKFSLYDLKFLQIYDLTADVLDLMLRYVYLADAFVQTPEMAAKLSIAAERYEIHALKDKCSRLLS